MQDAKRTPISLTARLLLCYILGCVLSIVVAGYYFRNVLKDYLVDECYELLVFHITGLQNTILTNADEPMESTQAWIQYNGQHPFHTIDGRLVDADGNVIFSTAAMSSMAPSVADFPAKISADQDQVILQGEVDPSTGCETYWLALKVAGLRDNEEIIYQAMYINRYKKEWLKHYDHAWILAVLVGSLTSAFVGWLIARNGLKPLFQITRSLKKITAHDFHERINTDGWPREVSALAREFDQVLTRLHHSFRQLSQFTADAAHEFRTPLNNLMGATSLALSKERSPEQYQTLLQSHIEQYNRLNRMIESLLFLARADNSSTGFQLQSVDAGACAAEVLDFFSAVADERGVTLHVDGQATIMADVSMLRIALTNLVSNGLRFTPEGKSLSIRVERNAMQEVVISVIDSGPGIAPEHYAQIFDRYYRLEKSRSTEGAGLGLSIVQTIMQLHGGRALVDRSPEGGAVFSLVFPGPTNPSSVQSSGTNRTTSR